jgi:hypothetical protein
VSYGIGFPWPVASDGEGGSLELIHPSLDNDLGGSWRASGVPESQRVLPDRPLAFVRARSLYWHFRKGDSEPSEDPGAWQRTDFVEDETWSVGPTSIGYGGDDDLTGLSDMKGKYTSVYLRHAFWTTNLSAIPKLRLRVYTGDGCVVWLNGIEAARFHVAAGERSYSDVSGEEPRTPRWEEIDLSARAGELIQYGWNVMAVHALNAGLDDTDFSMDLELGVPAAQAAPTPGARNSVYAERAPPQIRQVNPTPAQPPSGKPVVVSAKVTDPDGVQSVRLYYQVVRAGEFIPAFLPLPHDLLLAAPETPLSPNPAFEAAENWVEMEMRDDGTGGDLLAGDSVYAATLPSFGNRTLVRYRIWASDAGTPAETVRVPYPDDPSLNFAFFVFDGVPAYRPDLATVHPEGLGHEYSTQAITSVPVYHVLVREGDFLEAHGYDPALQIPQWRAWPNDYHPAYDKYNWESALVYEGEVYDHVPFRLRQANARYLGSGKRSLRFRFNLGHPFQARDGRGQAYPFRWRMLNLGRMIDVMGNSNFGLVESMNRQLWELMDVPVPRTHYVHLRVADGPEESPAVPGGQYSGDFWGLYLAMEDYDAEFLDSRSMADGSLYKLQAYTYDGDELKRHQGKDSVQNDRDFQNVWRNVAPEREESWLRAHIDFDRWYRYCAVADAVRHVDFGTTPSMMKNQAWFFEPMQGNPLGRLWVLPWDSDVSWGPGWGEVGYDFPRYALFHTNNLGPFALRSEFRAVIRDFRDLVWREDVIGPMLDAFAASIREISMADRDRWRNAPYGGDSGSIEEKVLDMKKFAFSGWQGAMGLPVPEGGRAVYLDDLAAAEGESFMMPYTPAIRYVGDDFFPVDSLIFALSRFGDPQGGYTFGVAKWRVAEVTDPSAPAYQSGAPLCFEARSVWESEEQTQWRETFRVSGENLLPGHAYRVRAKVRDRNGYWSHWSDPVEFIVGKPLSPPDLGGSLRVSEIMYHALAGEVFDYIEIGNVGSEAIPLATVELQGEVQFVFRGAGKRTLAPGERVVLVSNRECFRQRYPNPSIQVLGEFSGSLSNKRGVLSLVDTCSGQSWRMAYEDNWYPETDGEGYSLVLEDPASSSSVASSKEGWRPSLWVYGTPGTAQEETDRDGDGLPDAWESMHGLDASVPVDIRVDLDGDGLSTWQEFQAGTDPNSAESTVRLEVALLGSRAELRCTTIASHPSQGYSGTRYYQVERAQGLGAIWEPITIPHVGTGSTIRLRYPVTETGMPVFYRMKIWLNSNPR